jgi:hypothetical protein
LSNRVAIRTREIYRSANGDRWLLAMILIRVECSSDMSLTSPQVAKSPRHVGFHYGGSKYTQAKEKDDDSQRIILFASRDVNACDVRNLIRGASKCGDVWRNSCAVQLKQKLLRHRSRGPVLFLPEIRTRWDVFRSNIQARDASGPIRQAQISRDPAEFWPWTLFAFELRSRQGCLRGRWSLAEVAGRAAISCRSRDDPAAAN